MNDGSTRLYNVLMGNPDYGTSRNIARRVVKNTEADENFFVNRGKSIENALGTTGATAVGGINELIVNENRNDMRKSQKERMNDVAKKYGYNTYHDVWDAKDKAEASGDQETLDKINNVINPELQAQANANKKEADKFASDYKDYVENDYIGQKTNQDRGKFAGSAIKTLSTAADVMLPAAGVAFNAAQGGLEGVADELEQNGLENFDWQRAGQNALVGATTGAVVGGLNKGLNSALAKRGGNLLKGGNKLTQALNNFNSTNPVGQIASTVGTGVTRGALSGAVGGATGAGLSAALNNQDVLASAVEGAKRGASQGALAGGVMSGANIVANKTPGIKDVMQGINEASEDWRNSGRTFNERLTNTLNSGDSAIGNWLNRKSQSNLLGAAGSIGNRIQDTGNIDPWDKIAQQSGYDNYDQVIQRYMEANPDTPLNPNGAAGQIMTWLDENPNTPTTAQGWLKRAGQRVVEDVNNSNLGNRIKDVAEEIPADIQNMQINRNDMLNYTDDNTEPITVEQALGQTGRANRLNTTQDEQPETILNKQNAIVGAQDVEANNSGTKLYNQLTNNKTSREAQLRNAAGLKLQQQYGTIDKPTAKATNAPETLQKIKNAGFVKPADVERMADVITGSNGEVSKLVSNLVETAKPINTFDGETQGQTLKDYIDIAVQKRGLNGINEGKAVKSQIDALMKSLPSHADGSITFEDNPQDVFRLTQMLDSEAAQYEGRSGMNYGTTTPDKMRAAQVIKDVSNLLKDRVYSTVDVKKALTPDVAENLKSYAPNNKEFADYVDNTIMKAQNVADLRSAQAPWVRAKKIIDNGYMNSITYGGRVGNSMGIPATKRGLTTAALNATINSGPGLRAQAKILDKAADWVGKNSGDADNVATANANGSGNNALALTTANGADNVATNITPATQIYNMIGRTEGNAQGEKARAPYYLAQTAQEAEIVPNTGSQTIDGSNTLYNQLYGNTGGNTSAQLTGTNTMPNNNGYQSLTGEFNTLEEEQANYFFPPTGDYWADMLSRAMRRAKDAEDYKSMGSLYEMYQDAISSNKKNAEKDYTDVTNWNTTDRSKLLDAQNSLGQIDLLESAYNSATGGNGGNAIQGGLRSVAANILGGNLDPTANNYNKQAESIGMGIVKNMINLGVTEADAKRYLEYLPSLSDTKEQADIKLATLRQAYQNIINNLYSSYGL